MVQPSLVGVKVVEVTASATGVAAGGSVTVEVSLPESGIILGVPILKSRGTYTGDVKVLYGISNGFVVELANSDGTNAQDVSAVFDVIYMPEV